MKLSGFTFIRNGSKLHYPFIESISSLLPIVEEYIVLICNSIDNTKDLIESIKNDKIKIYESDWNENRISGGNILSEKTNESLRHVTGDYAFYLQGDELVHEKDYDNILKTLEDNFNNTKIKGFVFDYCHFLGGFFSYPKKEYVKDIFYYDHETRIIRNDKTVLSFGDATGFITKNGTPVSIENNNAVRIGGEAKIYHYGKALKPEYNYNKELNMRNIQYEKILARLKTWAFSFNPKVDKYITKASGLRSFADHDFLEFIERGDKNSLLFHPQPIRDLANQQNWDFSEFQNYNKNGSRFTKFLKLVIYRAVNEIITGIKKIKKKLRNLRNI